MIRLFAKNLEELEQVVENILPLLEHSPVVAIYGPMGVGKTTLIKKICIALNVNDMVNSPSFNIINEYLDGNNNIIYHFDLYRLQNEKELTELGGEDYFYSGNTCFIEWPENAAELLPEKHINIIIKELPDGTRDITINKSFTNS